jgi:hypothetical protein
VPASVKTFGVFQFLGLELIFSPLRLRGPRCISQEASGLMSKILDTCRGRVETSTLLLSHEKVLFSRKR